MPDSLEKDDIGEFVCIHGSGRSGSGIQRLMSKALGKMNLGRLQQGGGVIVSLVVGQLFHKPPK